MAFNGIVSLARASACWLLARRFFERRETNVWPGSRRGKGLELTHMAVGSEVVYVLALISRSFHIGPLS